MSLAATFAAGGMRPASFLPAIKCSNCGNEIEIAAMGDHICADPPPSPNTMPAGVGNPFTLRQFNVSGPPPASSPLHHTRPTPPHPTQPAPPQTRVRAPAIASNSMPAPQTRRRPPPLINPDAANMPFLPPRPPRQHSPVSPAVSARSGSSNGSKPSMLRSTTSPVPRSIFNVRPPSPELSASFDCAFPPFAPGSTGTNSRPGTSNGHITPNNERAPSRGGLRQDGRLGPKSESPSFEPKGPLPMGDENVMSRMKNVMKGPFDGDRRRPSREDSSPQDSQQLDWRRPGLPSNNLPPSIPDEPVPRPSTSHTMPTEAARSKSTKPPPLKPARPAEDVLLPTFLNKLSSEPVAAMPSTFSPSQPPMPPRSSDRSRTLPVRQESAEEPTPSQLLPRRPSEPALHGRERRPKLTAELNTAPARVPQMEAARERSLSRSGERRNDRMGDAPPMLRPVQQHSTDSERTPSESGSSMASSAHSLGNQSSSGPSFSSSAASSVDALEPLSQELASYGDDARMRIPGLHVKGHEQPGMRAEQPKSRASPKSFARPLALQEPVRAPEPSATPAAAEGQPLESPMDPAMENGRRGTADRRYSPITPAARPALVKTVTAPMPQARSQSPPPSLSRPPVPPVSSDIYDAYRPDSPQPPVWSRSKSNAPRPQPQPFNAPAPSRAWSPQPPTIPPPPSIPQETPRAQALQRKPPAGKATCRGCNTIIEGKSVKAADGRLTGRWHKACFMCRSCHQPFATADFYVIDNQPYCEQHYHENNGSLCHGCHRGIEGQYLETTTSSSSGSTEAKYHPRCFTCHACRQVLAEDYFEISGKVYCERHALATMRGQARAAGPGGGALNPPNWRAERRTTRLMMM